MLVGDRADHQQDDEHNADSYLMATGFVLATFTYVVALDRGRRAVTPDGRPDVPGALARDTRQPAELLRLHCPIRASAVHSMTGETYRSVGLRGPKIVAVSTEAGGLDDLARTGTIVTDSPEMTLLPAFSDSHEHMISPPGPKELTHPELTG